MATTDLGFPLPADSLAISEFAAQLRAYAEQADAVIQALAGGPQGEQGLPGVNAVPADEAVAGYISATTSATRTAADARYAAKPVVDDLETQVDALTADPGNGVTSLWVPAKNLDLVSGPGSYAAMVSRLAGWLLTKSATPSYLTMALRLPSHWATVFVDVVWCNTVANAGDVAWTAGVHNFAIGESFNATPVGGAAIAAAPATPWLPALTTIGAAMAVTPAKYTTFRVSRNGASSSNTLPNDVGVLGVQLRKAS